MESRELTLILNVRALKDMNTKPIDCNVNR